MAVPTTEEPQSNEQNPTPSSPKNENQTTNADNDPAGSTGSPIPSTDPLAPTEETELTKQTKDGKNGEAIPLTGPAAKDGKSSQSLTTNPAEGGSIQDTANTSSDKDSGGLKIPPPPDPSAIMKKIPTPNASLAMHLNKADTDVGEVNGIWNTWLNFYSLLCLSPLIVEPSAHRYDLNDRLLPDIMIYPFPEGQATPKGPPDSKDRSDSMSGSSPEPNNKWKVVYYGTPGTGAPPIQPPSPAQWDTVRDMLQYICDDQKQKPSWGILAIGSWVRFYAFLDGKMEVPAFFNVQYCAGACIPLSLPGQPDQELSTQSFISVNIGLDQHAAIFKTGIPMIFLAYMLLPNPLPGLPPVAKEAMEKVISALPKPS